ncbi:MAG: hypothetical protein CVU67_06440 [Deltaproteobacteria bacterium HGW-Deltaproteobacteria-24]|nr:MAG: hypothetical protein CVU67_06440 [Deltaproteobacteria bacterium HGW-Deltaproteobacteria-24]
MLVSTGQKRINYPAKHAISVQCAEIWDNIPIEKMYWNRALPTPQDLHHGAHVCGDPPLHGKIPCQHHVQSCTGSTPRHPL